MQLLIFVEGLLLRAIPTFILVWILHWYVSRVFYRPLQQALKKRAESTEGLRKAAEGRISQAEQKATEYDDALRASRAELYRQQEEDRQKVLAHRTEILKGAKQTAEQKIAEARAQVQSDVRENREVLAKESGQMADWITRAILEDDAKAPVKTEVVS